MDVKTISELPTDGGRGSLANVVYSAHLVCSFFVDSYTDLKAH